MSTMLSDEHPSSFYADAVDLDDNALRPERSLMAAILERAILDYSAPSSRAFLNQDERQSARRWLFSDRRTKYLFTFLNVCEALELDPTAIRKAAERIKAEQNGSLKKAEG